MHEFTPESVEKYLTPESLKKINVGIPDNEGEYMDTEAFITPTEETQKLVDTMLSSIDEIIENNELPNIQGDHCLGS